MAKSSPVSGVYAIQQQGTDRYYVGQSNNIEARWREHTAALRNQRHHSKFLQRAWDKYGEDAFTWVILHVTDDLEELTALEQWYMDTLNCTFNGRPAADSMRGFRHSSESLEKMSASARKRGQSPAILAYYERLSETMRGPHPERGPAISVAKKGRGKGVPWSPARRASFEARTEPSEKQRAEYARRPGRQRTPEAITKQRASVQRIIRARGRLGAIIKYDSLAPEELIAHLRAHLERVARLEAEGKMATNPKEAGRRRRMRAKTLARIAELEAQCGLAASQPAAE
jgi:group I intron endonuclease